MSVIGILLTIQYALIWVFLKYCPEMLLYDRDEDDLTAIYVANQRQTRRGKWVLYYWRHNPDIINQFFAPHTVYYVTKFGTYYYNDKFLTRYRGMRGEHHIKIYCNTLDFDFDIFK